MIMMMTTWRKNKLSTKSNKINLKKERNPEQQRNNNKNCQLIVLKEIKINDFDFVNQS